MNPSQIGIAIRLLSSISMCILAVSLATGQLCNAEPPKVDPIYQKMLPLVDWGDFPRYFNVVKKDVSTFSQVRGDGIKIEIPAITFVAESRMQTEFFLPSFSVRFLDSDGVSVPGGKAEIVWDNAVTLGVKPGDRVRGRIWLVSLPEYMSKVAKIQVRSASLTGD